MISATSIANKIKENVALAEARQRAAAAQEIADRASFRAEFKEVILKLCEETGIEIAQQVDSGAFSSGVYCADIPRSTYSMRDKYRFSLGDSELKALLIELAAEISAEFYDIAAEHNWQVSISNFLQAKLSLVENLQFKSTPAKDACDAQKAEKAKSTRARKTVTKKAK